MCAHEYGYASGKTTLAGHICKFDGKYASKIVWHTKCVADVLRPAKVGMSQLAKSKGTLRKALLKPIGARTQMATSPLGKHAQKGVDVHRARVVCLMFK